MSIEKMKQEAQLEFGDKLHWGLVHNGTFRSCINCAHFNELEYHCSAWNTTPPPDVIVFSCKTPAWQILAPF